MPDVTINTLSNKLFGQYPESSRERDYELYVYRWIDANPLYIFKNSERYYTSDDGSSKRCDFNIIDILQNKDIHCELEIHLRTFIKHEHSIENTSIIFVGHYAIGDDTIENELLRLNPQLQIIYLDKWWNEQNMSLDANIYYIPPVDKSVKMRRLIRLNPYDYDIILSLVPYDNEYFKDLLNEIYSLRTSNKPMSPDNIAHRYLICYRKAYNLMYKYPNFSDKMLDEHMIQRS
jgi:hypothetical protein